MVFRVDITEPALLDAEEYVGDMQVVNREPDAAERWFRGLVAAIYSLERMPERCPLIPEADYFDERIRQLIYHSHRIVFGIDRENGRVVVYRVYHGARETLGPSDLTPES